MSRALARVRVECALCAGPSLARSHSLAHSLIHSLIHYNPSPTRPLTHSRTVRSLARTASLPSIASPSSRLVPPLDFSPQPESGTSEGGVKAASKAVGLENGLLFTAQPDFTAPSPGGERGSAPSSQLMRLRSWRATTKLDQMQSSYSAGPPAAILRGSKQGEECSVDAKLGDETAGKARQGGETTGMKHGGAGEHPARAKALLRGAVSAPVLPTRPGSGLRAKLALLKQEHGYMKQEHGYMAATASSMAPC